MECPLYGVSLKSEKDYRGPAVGKLVGFSRFRGLGLWTILSL